MIVEWTGMMQMTRIEHKKDLRHMHMLSRLSISIMQVTIERQLTEAVAIIYN